MKKIIKGLLFVLAVTVFTVSESKAQEIVVHAQMHRTGVFVRPARPSRDHVWVSEEWSPGGGTYVHHDGYWAVPPHPGAVWVAGHWRHRPRGYVWIGGHWSM